MGYIMDLRKYVGHAPLIMAGAGVLVLSENNEVLLQKRSDNLCWGIIGGSIELGETLEETAKREALEEAGIEVFDLKLFNVYSGPNSYYKYPNGDEVYNVATIYTTYNYSGDLRPDKNETLELKFFPIDSIPNKINPPDKIILKDLVAQITNAQLL